MADQISIPEVKIGKIRIQVLSDFLLRLEMSDSSKFEDQITFNVVERSIAKSQYKVFLTENSVRIKTSAIEFSIPIMASGFDEAKVRHIGHTKWVKLAKTLNYSADMPSPSKLPIAWSFRDFPCVVPPKWGATAPPRRHKDEFLAGWQVSDVENDHYVFFPFSSGYEKFISEFLKLTGRIPLIPKAALGFIYSRYHPFSDEEILSLIDKFKLLKSPIDIFVVDTDWREGSSVGYEVNKKYFPDIEKFFLRAHGRGVKIMMNDHPKPIDEPLSYKELSYRELGLNRLIQLGLDYWWFDRNWKVSLDEPFPGLSKEIWGMRLYWEIVSKYKRWSRTLIMSNAPGIRNGQKEKFNGVVAHKYPICWTGDTKSDWDSLKRGIENAVNEGIFSLMTFLSEDIGGHLGNPTPELYSRFVQFATFSPIFRLHCTAGETRDPWEFGDEAERITLNCIQLRLRLLPMIYRAALRASEEGTPILGRCDIEWPDCEESSSTNQYMFCGQILVAPVAEPTKKHKLYSEPVVMKQVFLPPGTWHDLWTGNMIEGPSLTEVACSVWKIPLFARSGAIILSQPEAKNSSEQSWETIIADLFVPDQAGYYEEILYEDDGETVDYKDGLFCKTSFKMMREVDILKLIIENDSGTFPGQSDTKNWTLRFHLPQNTQLVSMHLNGNVTVPGKYNVARFGGRPLVMPIFSQEDIAGEQSGEVIEVCLKNIHVLAKNEVSLKLNKSFYEQKME